jgi:hypothetical protein
VDLQLATAGKDASADAGAFGAMVMINVGSSMTVTTL